MTDTVKKVVEYEIRGNTVNLEKELTAAIDNVNALQNKIQYVSTIPYMRGKKDVTNYTRSSTLSKTMTQLEGLKTKLSSGSIEAVTPDQLALIQQINNELAKYNLKINDVNKSNSISQKTFEKMKASLSDMNYTLKKTGIYTNDASKGFKAFIESLSIGKILLVYKYISKLYDAAADFIETMNLFNVAVKGANEELTSFITTMSTAFGLDTEPLYRATAIFKQLANTLGDTSNASIAFTKGITQLTYDLASLYNIDVDNMISAVKSGLTGMTKPMMRYGISVHKATVEQIALQKGITKTYSEMNEIEKMYVRYIAILEQAKNAQGDMAKTLESPANQLRILKDQISVLIRNVGNFVMLGAQILLPLLTGLVTGINNVLSAMSKAAGYEIPDYSDNLSENNQILDDGTDSVEEYEEALNGLLAPLDEINQANKTGSNQDLVSTIDQSILDALSTYDNLMDKVSSKTQVFADIFNSVFNPQIFTAIGNVLGTALDLISTSLEAVADILNAIQPALDIVTTGIGYMLTGITWLIDKAIKPLQWWIEGITANIWTLVAAFTAFNILQLAVTGNAKKMIAVKIVLWLKAQAVQLAKNLVFYAQYYAFLIKEKIAAMAAAAAEWWHNASLAAKIGLITFGAGLIIVPIALAAAGVFENKSKQSSVAAMATGGVVSGPTYALIGEGKYDEAVLPLGRSPQMRELKRDIADEVIRNTSQTPRNVQQRAQPTTVILQLDGRELGRTTINQIGKVRKQVGVDI